MAQHLRALPALPEDRGSIPGTHTRTHIISNSSSRGFDNLFWPWRALHTCGTDAHSSTNTPKIKPQKIQRGFFFVSMVTHFRSYCKLKKKIKIVSTMFTDTISTKGISNWYFIPTPGEIN